MKKWIFTIGFISTMASAALADVVEFHIANGTGPQAWNTQDTAIWAKVGDVVRFYNDDVVDHRLHTFGLPCAHGPNMAPGTQWDCNVTGMQDSKNDGPLYDHHYGRSAEVWFEITE